MQLLTLKVGDPMTQQIRQSEESKNRLGGSTNRSTSTKGGTNFIKIIARAFCHVRLKMQLKEMGSAVKCEGKLILAGTKNIKIGDRSHFNKNVILKTEDRGYIHIGENVKIGRNVRIISKYNVTIEDNTIIGSDVTIRDILTDDNETLNRSQSKPVYIGKDVWIGKGTEVQAGVTIGHGATISSNSVVSRSLPPQVIAGGAPAKIIKER